MLALTILNWLFRGQVNAPVENPTKSYWQSPPADIADHQSTAELPDELFDYCIIGSGMTGASTCMGLLEGDAKCRVIMLEARQLCSGATGRNGGQMLRQSFVELHDGIRRYGFEEAIAQYRFTHQNFEQCIDYIHANDLAEEVGLRVEKRREVFFEPERWEDVKRIYQQIEARGIDLSEVDFYEGEEADKAARSTGALGAYSHVSGLFWPYKFVSHLLRKSIALGLQCYANTPVTKVTRDTSGQFSHVQTSRGTVRAKTVIFATNAYVAQLLPELHVGILPVRGSVVALKPEGALKEKALGGPYIIWEGETTLDTHEYMQQRMTNGKPSDIIIGGRMFAGDNLDLANQDDSTFDPKVFKRLREEMPALFKDEWRRDGAISSEAHATHEWTGIQGVTVDRKAIVGQLATPGHWVAAGFSGIGMSWCFKTGLTLAKMIRKEDLGDVKPSLLYTDPQQVGIWNSLKKLVQGTHV